ncbi:sensor histidine kinase [Paenibacillus sp. y28]|uniref:sensor histidine kinase n=1 Tax=Paenibacillus sp. y28 TaxID=3129110 RepID=UPI003016E5EA
MPLKLTIFGKIMILLVLLLIPILLLYSFSNRITNQVVQEQINASSLNQLVFFMRQLDSNMEQLSMFPIILGNDPHIREYIDRTGGPLYDPLRANSRLMHKLNLQSVSNAWSNDLTMVIAKEKQVLSSNIFLNGSSDWAWQEPVHSVWTYEQQKLNGNTTGGFIREISEPANARTAAQASALYQVRFSASNLMNRLDEYKEDKHSDPFLLHQVYDPIWNSTSSREITGPIAAMLRERPLDRSGQVELTIREERYLVSYVKSEQLDWVLVDYVPVQSILSPITKTRNLFYISIGLLLALSVLAVFLLYRNVQIPIVQMLRSLQRMSRGDLSARIQYRSKNEFDYLIRRFNEMAEQIQVLVEDVYAEKIRAREATLKQLQAQINPHFLYNSLFFIVNSAKLEDHDAVVAMAENLAKFYRYTTRVENQTVRLEEELDLVRNYLNIQILRMHRLSFSIAVDEAMLGELVPRLILQPLVENAIVHGIEGRVGGGHIHITGEQTAVYNRILIEDNGAGLSVEQLTSLHLQLQQSMTEEMGCGTWNVHHRLFYQFGEGSGLQLERRAEGGLRAIVTWNRRDVVKPLLN